MEVARLLVKYGHCRLEDDEGGPCHRPIRQKDAAAICKTWMNRDPARIGPWLNG